MKYLFLWKNPSIRDDLRKIKLTLKLIYHKWVMGISKVQIDPFYDLLNIGCGSLIRVNWINMDLFPIEGAYYVDGVN